MKIDQNPAINVNFHQLESDTAMDELLGKVNLPVISPNTMKQNHTDFSKRKLLFFQGEQKHKGMSSQVPLFSSGLRKILSAKQNKEECGKTDVL